MIIPLASRTTAKSEEVPDVVRPGSRLAMRLAGLPDDLGDLLRYAVLHVDRPEHLGDVEREEEHR